MSREMLFLGFELSQACPAIKPLQWWAPGCENLVCVKQQCVLLILVSFLNSWSTQYNLKTKLNFYSAGIFETDHSHAPWVPYSNVSRERHWGKQSEKWALSLLYKSETTVGASTREPGERAWQEQHGLRRGLLDRILNKKRDRHWKERCRIRGNHA